MDGTDVTAEGTTELGGRLDDDHLPETNGRMGVCRRCGSVTDGPAGAHRPVNRQLGQLATWLEGQRQIAGKLLVGRRADT